MSEPSQRRHNRSQNRQLRVTGPRFTDEERVTFGVLRTFRDEIENVKDEIRSAVVLEVRRAEGETLSDDELKVIDDKQLNLKVLERLEAVHNQIDKKHRTESQFQFLSDSDIWHLIHFFYVVRLAQQGFFHIISNQFPSIEPQAITYLADQLVSHSLYARQSVQIRTRVEHKDKTRAIVKKFRDRVDEPVGEGFKTTFKQVMEVVEQLTEMAFSEEDGRRRKEEQTDTPASSNSFATTVTSSNTSASPAVWVLMPYTNMTDGNTVALPGMKPSTLPFPSELLQQMPTRNLPQIYPFMPLSVPPQQQQPIPESHPTPNVAPNDTSSAPVHNLNEPVSTNMSSSVSVVSNGTSSEKPHSAEQSHSEKPASSSATQTAPRSHADNNTAPPSATGSSATTNDNTAFEYSRPEEFEDIDAFEDQFADADDEDQFADPEDNKKQARSNSSNQNNISDNVSGEISSDGNRRRPESKNGSATTRSFMEGNRNRRTSNDTDGLNQWKSFAAHH